MSSSNRYSGSNRMRDALAYAKSRPKRTTVAQQQPQKFGLDPNWQRKMSGQNQRSYNPQTKVSSSFGGGMGFSSSSSARSTRTSAMSQSQRRNGFDKNAFLRAQQKGDFRRKNNNGMASRLAGGSTTNTHVSHRSRTGAVNNSGFDIEQFKAQQPRMHLK